MDAFHFHEVPPPVALAQPASPVDSPKHSGSRSLREIPLSRNKQAFSAVSEGPADASLRHNLPRDAAQLQSHSSLDGLSSKRTSDTDATDTDATSADLPALQSQSMLEPSDKMEPLTGDPFGSFDLVAPPDTDHQIFSLEHRSELLFSRQHLAEIFADSASLLRFTAFLSTYRPQSVPLLIYYLDALKALKALGYANAVIGALRPVAGHAFSEVSCKLAHNSDLEQKAAHAFQALTNTDLPAYITHTYIHVVSQSISRRITGSLSPQLRDASEGLAEVFCLTDPSRADNPIVFASEEFNRTTQYGLGYVLGRNCRFLQGPKTNPLSVDRLRTAVTNGEELCEVFLNYRRDGSPFMNLLMIAPLRDSRGKIRYFIGAQVDVTGLVKDCKDLEALQQLVRKDQDLLSGDRNGGKDDFRELSEMLNTAELDTVKKYGGRMHRDYCEDDVHGTQSKSIHMPRLMLQDPSSAPGMSSQGRDQGGRLSGIYQNYLLIRPYPSFRILFASPTLRVPGMLQSPFMERIGGSNRVRDELSAALAEGRGVTAKVRWLSKFDDEGRNRWIHCTPLIGSNGQIGVWMVVLVDDDDFIARRWRQAPPVAGPHRGKVFGGRSSSSRVSKESFDSRRHTPGTQGSISPSTVGI